MKCISARSFGGQLVLDTAVRELKLLDPVGQVWLRKPIPFVC